MTCSTKVCATCAWWVRKGPRLAEATRDPSAAADTGTCQAHAPVVLQGNTPFPVPLFPTTHESRFCGEWAPAAGGGGGGETVIPFTRAAA